MSSQKTLLYFVTEDWYFCSHRLALAVAASRAGYNVKVVTRVRQHGRLIQEAGLELLPFELSRRGMNPIAEIRTLLGLISIYRQHRPDIVHQVAMKPVIYGSIAAWVAGVPQTINALAGLGWLFISTDLKARLASFLVKASLRWVLGQGRVIVQNPDDALQLQSLGVKPKAICIIHGSGVDLQVFTHVPEPEGVPIVVLPARLLWDKGVKEFVGAARRLKSEGIQARWVLVGEPDTENPAMIPHDQLEAWLKEGIVEWWGMRTDMPQVMHAATVVCLPSYREGLPKALLEAAAAGRPIVTTDVPGCREIVADGDNGLLVPPRDEAALARALKRLLADPDLRRKMGARGRQRVLDEFDVNLVVADTLKLYRECVA